MFQIITKTNTYLTRFAQEWRGLHQEKSQGGRGWLIAVIVMLQGMTRRFVHVPCTNLTKLCCERVFTQIGLLRKFWLSLQDRGKAMVFFRTWYGEETFAVTVSLPSVTASIFKQPFSAPGCSRKFFQLKFPVSHYSISESLVAFSEVAVSQKTVVRSALFYTANLTSRIGSWWRWFTPPVSPRFKAIVIPKEKLIRRHSLLGSLAVIWQTVRLQGQRYARFNARTGGFVAKRLFDIVVSASVLVFLSPILLLLALLIRLDSPGSIFFPQIRIGKQGKVFTMWKFRSMYVDAEQRRAALLEFNEMKGGVLFKMKNDPRTTRVGRFLRKFSLDELPQFWNVLVGDMSLVGPRPPLPNEVVVYSPFQRQRLDVTPGITCIWQVSGRSEIPFHQQVEMDLLYIATQSFMGDIVLLLKTVPAVLKGRGAY